MKYYKTRYISFLFLAILMISCLTAISQTICDNAGTQVFTGVARVISITENNCAINITVAPHLSFSDRTPACSQLGAIAEQCQNGFVQCPNNCYRYMLLIDNQVIRNTCSNNDQHTFQNVAAQGQYKVVVEYRHVQLCNSVPLCFAIVDNAIFTLGASFVCDQITEIHNNNQFAFITREEVIEIGCIIQDNKFTDIRSSQKIIALPGSRSGTGVNTFFHAKIGACPKSASFFDNTMVENIDAEQFIREVLYNDKKKPVFESLTYIYPNPSTGIFNAVVSGSFENGKYQIYDFLGRTVAKGQIITKRFSIDLSGKENGIYTIVFSNGTNIDTQKIIKQ